MKIEGIIKRHSSGKYFIEFLSDFKQMSSSASLLLNKTIPLGNKVFADGGRLIVFLTYKIISQLGLRETDKVELQLIFRQPKEIDNRLPMSLLY